MKTSTENARLWATYCDLRDNICQWHKECLDAGQRTPRGVFVFVTNPREQWRRYVMPTFIYPKRLNTWLKQAIKRCHGALNSTAE